MVAPVAAAAARGAAGKAAAGKAAAGSAPAAAAAGAPKPAPPAVTRSAGASGPPAALTSQRGAPQWYRTATDPLPLANTGGGFVLGLLGYVLVLNYVRDGKDGVKAWLRAKFLNQVGPA